MIFKILLDAHPLQQKRIERFIGRKASRRRRQAGTAGTVTFSSASIAALRRFTSGCDGEYTAVFWASSAFSAVN